MKYVKKNLRNKRNLSQVLQRCMFPIIAGIYFFLNVQAFAVPSEEELLIRGKQSNENREYHPNYPEILERIKNGDFSAAESIASAAIERKGSGENPQRESFLKADAYRHRALAREHMGVSKLKLAFQDFIEAAKLGHKIAIQDLYERHLVMMLAERNLGEIISIGADIGDPYSYALAAKAATVDDDLERFSRHQLLFYELLADTESSSDKLILKIEKLEQETDVRNLLRDNSFVGGPIASDSRIGNGRDILATLYAEYAFRLTLGHELAFAMREKPAKHDDPSARQIIELSTYVTELRGMASANIMAPEDLHLGPQTLVMPLSDIAQAIGPGDSIYVRCGSLAHVTQVFSVDPKHDEIILMDGFFQFWQPSHNLCIQTFSQEHWKYGYYHTKLKLTEVLKILVAVSSYRTYEPPTFVDEIGGSGTDMQVALQDIAQKDGEPCSKTPSKDFGIIDLPLKEATKLDIFSLGDFEEIAKRSIGNGLSSRLLLSRLIKFRSQVMLVLRTNPHDCVRSASFFLRLFSYRDEEKLIFAMGLLGEFLEQTLGKGGIKTFAVGAKKESGETAEDLVRQFSAAVRGDRESFALKGSSMNVQLRNVIAKSGAKWVRIDVW
jgi:hypothetical protein